MWYVLLSLLFVKVEHCFYYNVFYITWFFIHLVILLLLACNVDGADGDGNMQGTCSDAGQKCKADGTCGTYYYHYYCKSTNFALITL